MDITTVTKVRTKLSKNDTKSTVTELTLDWTKCTDAQIVELAQRSAVIQYQSLLRISGNIPAEDKLDVASLFVKGPRAANNTPEAIAAKAAKDPEFKAAMMAALGVKGK